MQAAIKCSFPFICINLAQIDSIKYNRQNHDSQIGNPDSYKIHSARITDSAALLDVSFTLIKWFLSKSVLPADFLLPRPLHILCGGVQSPG